MFTTSQALARGLTMSELKWGEQTGTWRRALRSVYCEGREEPSEFDRLVARAVRSGAPARGPLAGLIHDLDAVRIEYPRRLPPLLSPDRIVIMDGFPCADGLQTLVDLAAVLGDARWEQALESGLRKDLTSMQRSNWCCPGWGVPVPPARPACAGYSHCVPQVLFPLRVCSRR